MNTSTGIAVAIAVIAVAFIFFGHSMLALFSVGGSHPVQNSSTVYSSTVSKSTASTSPSTSGGLSVINNVVGTGAVAQSGDTVAVLYKGSLQNGTVFDSSQAHKNKPLIFKLGAHRVIPGMEQGIIGMKVGGARTITIPPSLGYGARGYGPIPPNAELIFQVQLVNVTSPTK